MAEIPLNPSAAAPAAGPAPGPVAVPAGSPQAAARRAHSPCMGVCRMDVDGKLCVGCLRTLDEVASWSTATEETRFAILKNVAERRAATEAQP